VTVHVSGSAKSWKLEVFRIGYYAGLGGALIERVGPFSGHRGKPAKVVDGAQVANWPVAATIDTAAWPEGFYLLHVVVGRKRTTVPLVVRSASAKGKVAMISSVTTWQAYNLWGGQSLYGGGAESAFEGRSHAVNFDRPYDQKSHDILTAFEIPLVRAAEESGVALAWLTNVDIALDPALLDGALGAASSGHDEYWPLEYRRALEKVRDGGGNLAFFGANAGYWRVRLGDPGTGAGRLMTCYKSASRDPVTGPTTTARWRDSPDAAPENEIVGQLYDSFPVQGAMEIVDPKFFLFAGTGVKAGARLEGLIGPEIDRVYPLSSTPRPIQVPALSPATCRGSQTWSTMAYYTTKSGAGVFSTGTMGWTRALPRPGSTPGMSDAAKAFSRTVTRNVFKALATSDLGKVHPATDQLEEVSLPSNNTSGAA